MFEFVAPLLASQQRLGTGDEATSLTYVSRAHGLDEGRGRGAESALSSPTVQAGMAVLKNVPPDGEEPLDADAVLDFLKVRGHR